MQIAALDNFLPLGVARGSKRRAHHREPLDGDDAGPADQRRPPYAIGAIADVADAVVARGVIGAAGERVVTTGRDGSSAGLAARADALLRVSCGPERLCTYVGAM